MYLTGSCWFTCTCRIAGNFRGRKLSWIVEKYDFCGENFRRLLAFAVRKDATPQILRRKLLHIATKPWNLRNFSPSKVSPLYGTNCIMSRFEMTFAFVPHLWCVLPVWQSNRVLTLTLAQLAPSLKLTLTLASFWGVHYLSWLLAVGENLEDVVYRHFYFDNG